MEVYFFRHQIMRISYQQFFRPRNVPQIVLICGAALKDDFVPSFVCSYDCIGIYHEIVHVPNIRHGGFGQAYFFGETELLVANRGVHSFSSAFFFYYLQQIQCVG